VPRLILPREIFRVWVKEHYQGDVFFNTVTPFQLGLQLEQNLPEVESATRYVTLSTSIKKGEQVQTEQIFLVEPSFLEIFDFPILSGSGSSALDGIRKLVLTEKSAEKYFGKGDPIGETLSLELEDEWVDFQISAIAKNPPTNTGFQFDFLIPFENTENLYSDQTRQSWTNVAVETFVKLLPKTDFIAFKTSLHGQTDHQNKLMALE